MSDVRSPLCFGTTAVREFPITDVQEWMGHADLATTRGYVHYVPKLDAAERLSRVWASDGVPQRVPT